MSYRTSYSTESFADNQTELPLLTPEEVTILETEKNFLRALPAKLDDTNDEVMYDRPSLIQAAIIYVSHYTGTFDYMQQMVADASIYGFRKWSMRKFRGVLNCLRAEAIHEHREAHPATPTALAGAATVEGGRTIPEGTYTAVFADGSHRTLRVKKHWVEEEAKKGTKVVQYLSGPDNESAYTGFAFLNGSQLRVWRKYAGNLDSAILEAAKIILRDPAAAGEAYALESSHCFRCGRKLTVPVSIHRGLGPECAAKWGH